MLTFSQTCSDGFEYGVHGLLFETVFLCTLNTNFVIVKNRWKVIFFYYYLFFVAFDKTKIRGEEDVSSDATGHREVQEILLT